MDVLGKIYSFRPLAGFWFLNGWNYVMGWYIIRRFRPLAGFWFLNVHVNELLLFRTDQVSVPLRGSGS